MDCAIKKSGKVKPSRDFDVLYDPTLRLPTEKDYGRELDKAAAMSLSYIIRPLFNTMFSDTRPSQELVPRKSVLQAIFTEKDLTSFTKCSSVDVTGSKRSLFFRQPLPMPRPNSSSTVLSLPEGILDEKQRHVKSATPTCCTKTTQTDYRESETQTKPWAHDVLAKQGVALLNLNWFNVGKNFPVGMEEIHQIERGAQREAWKVALERLRCVDFAQWCVISGAMIDNETVARETEIDETHILRMRNSVKQLAIDQLTDRNDLKGRLQRLLTLSEDNASEKLRYMKHQLNRGIRKIGMLERGISKKYRKRDILTEFRDKTSDIYLPQLRFGENPARKHQFIDVRCEFLQKYKGFEMLEKKVAQSTHPPRGFDFEKASKPRNSGISCKRREKIWECDYNFIFTNKEEGRHVQTGKESTVLSMRRTDLANTPEYDDNNQEWDSHEHWSNIILKSVIKGRAVQTALHGFYKDKT